MAGTAVSTSMYMYIYEDITLVQIKAVLVNVHYIFLLPVWALTLSSF